jgi:hypothetical protein
MMRVYIATTSDIALQLLEQGWRDLHTDLGRNGLWCNESPPTGVRPAAGRGTLVGGPQGDTVMCANVPEEVFRELEVEEATRPLTPEESRRVGEGGPEPEGLEYQRVGYAIIPAEVLNQHGRPQVYYEFATDSRAELLRAILGREQGEEGDQEFARAMRRAVDFLDRSGWRTPLVQRVADTAPNPGRK